MSSYKIFAVQDRKAKAIVATFTAPSEDAAKRSFISILTDRQQNVYTDFPEDFELFYVADLESGRSIKVKKPGFDHVNAAGFNVCSFNVDEPIDAGVDHPRAELDSIRLNRFKVYQELIKSVDDDGEGDVSDE